MPWPQKHIPKKSLPSAKEMIARWRLRPYEQDFNYSVRLEPMLGKRVRHIVPIV